MQEQLINFIEILKKDRKIRSFDEAATKQAVILKLLSLLGWDTSKIDEVTPEYSVSGKKVDYSLRINNANKAFIEVKKISEELENHQKQLLDYSFQEGIKISILTNGITWWFYLPLHEGSWEQRKFYTIDILQQKSEDIASKFIDFLSKDNISTGKAVQNAEAIYKKQQELKILKETLPKAWNTIIEEAVIEADGLLIDLLKDKTKKMCGFKADIELIDAFLSKHKDHLIISSIASEGPGQTQSDEVREWGETKAALARRLRDEGKTKDVTWEEVLPKLKYPFAAEAIKLCQKYLPGDPKRRRSGHIRSNFKGFTWINLNFRENFINAYIEVSKEKGEAEVRKVFGEKLQINSWQHGISFKIHSEEDFRKLVEWLQL